MSSQFWCSNDVLPEVGLADEGRWIRVHQWNVHIVAVVVVVCRNAIQVTTVGVNRTVAVAVVVQVTNVGIDLTDGLNDRFFAHFRYLRTDDLLQLGCALFDKIEIMLLT